MSKAIWIDELSAWPGNPPTSPELERVSLQLQPSDHSILQPASLRACSLQARRLQWSSSLQARALVFYSPPPSPAIRPAAGRQKAGEGRFDTPASNSRSDSSDAFLAAALTAQRPIWQLSGRSASSATDLAAQRPPGSSAADLAARQPI